MAVAAGRISMQPATFELVANGTARRANGAFLEPLVVLLLAVVAQLLERHCFAQAGGFFRRGEGVRVGTLGTLEVQGDESSHCNQAKNNSFHVTILRCDRPSGKWKSSTAPCSLPRPGFPPIFWAWHLDPCLPTITISLSSVPAAPVPPPHAWRLLKDCVPC